MFTKLGVTVASAALPVLLWAGAAGAQQSPEATDSQSQSTTSGPVTSLSNTSDFGGGTLARTGADDLVPLGVGGVVLAGAVGYIALRRRSVA